MAEWGVRHWKALPHRTLDRPQFVVQPNPPSPYRECLGAVKKPPGAFRILVFGDSYTYGVNVQASQTYPKVLEWMLNTAGHRPYEVWNLGVSGYTTEIELRTLASF